MPCNLNFNQCNSFINFPTPIYNCRCRLIALLNASTTTVINPTTVLSNVSFVATAQTILPQGNIVSTLNSNFTGAITVDSAGNITLPTGRYLITTTINGVIPTNATAEFALYQNGAEVSASRMQTSGTAGTSFSASMNNVVTVAGVFETFAIKNVNSVNQSINNASIFVQRVL